MVHEDGNGWRPFLKFSDPVRQGAQGRNDNVGSKVVLLFAKQANDTDGLDCFACL